MIRPLVKQLALDLLEKAVQMRKTMPREELVIAQMAMVEPREWPMADPKMAARAELAVVVWPADDLVQDDSGRILAMAKTIIANANPEAVIFWSETWVKAMKIGEKLDKQPREYPDRQEALMMVVQDRAETLMFIRRFHWEGSTCVVHELEEGGHTQPGMGRFTDWFGVANTTEH